MTGRLLAMLAGARSGGYEVAISNTQSRPLEESVEFIEATSRHVRWVGSTDRWSAQVASEVGV